MILPRIKLFAIPEYIPKSHLTTKQRIGQTVRNGLLGSLSGGLTGGVIGGIAGGKGIRKGSAAIGAGIGALAGGALGAGSTWSNTSNKAIDRDNKLRKEKYEFQTNPESSLLSRFNQDKKDINALSVPPEVQSLMDINIKMVPTLVKNYKDNGYNDEDLYILMTPVITRKSLNEFKNNWTKYSDDENDSIIILGCEYDTINWFPYANDENNEDVFSIGDDFDGGTKISGLKEALIKVYKPYMNNPVVKEYIRLIKQKL